MKQGAEIGPRRRQKRKPLEEAKRALSDTEAKPAESPFSAPGSTEPELGASPLASAKKLAAEKPEKPASEQIPSPYCCRNVARQSRKETTEVLKGLVERVMEGHESADQQKFKRIERRLRTFINEVFSKAEDHVLFEKVYQQKTQVTVAELDQELLTKLQAAQTKLKVTVEKLVGRKESLEKFFSTEIEKELTETFAQADQTPLPDLRIRSKSHTVPFDTFLDKFITSQKDYLTAITKASELLESNFEDLKLRAIKRFKELISAHTRTQQVVESQLMSLTSWEQCLLG